MRAEDLPSGAFAHLHVERPALLNLPQVSPGQLLLPHRSRAVCKRDKLVSVQQLITANLPALPFLGIGPDTDLGVGHREKEIRQPCNDLAALLTAFHAKPTASMTSDGKAARSL